MHSINRLALSALAGAALLCVTTSASADDDIMFGVRGGYYTKAEAPFAGAELLFRVSHSVYFNPNFEWVFADNRDYFTANADFHYDFPTHGRAYVWLGAGLALVRIDPDGPRDANTDAAANFFGGVGLKGRGAIPYFQAKVIAKDETEFVLGVGIRF